MEVAKNDSVKCRILLQVGYTQEYLDHKVSRRVYDSVLVLAQKNNYTLIAADAFLAIGNLGFSHGDYPSAIRNYNMAAEQYSLIGGDVQTGGLAAVYNNMGGILSLINEWESAQKYYLKSINEYEKLRDSARMETVYFNLAFVFSDMGEWGKSYEHMYKAFTYIHDSSNKSQNVHTCARLATICFKTQRPGDGLIYLSKTDSLLNYSQTSLDLIYHNHAYGEYYFYQKKTHLAVKHHKLAYYYALKWDDPYYLADESLEIGKDYLRLNQFDSADYYFQNSLNVATRYNYKPKVLSTLSYLSELEEAKGNYRNAYQYKKKQAAFADSLVREQNQYRIMLMNEEFAAEKKGNQIEQLQKDKQIQSLLIRQKSTLNYFLISFVAVLMLFGFLVYRNLRHRQQLVKQQGELHQQRIRELEKDRQLVAVDSLLKGQEEERSRLAKDLHDGLGGLLSGVKFSLSNMKSNFIVTPDNMTVFERSLDMLDTSIRELRRVAHNMMPEMLVKFGLDEALKDYCNSINATGLIAINYQSFGMEKRLDNSNEIIIYRIIQELLNNTLKHAAATEALVQLVKEEKRLNIVVEDNGRGFNTEIIETGKGAGWTSIRSRVDYLRGQLDVHSEAGKGTLVNIEFNI
ncbi:MAG: sensor histidine kinase [Chitinophagaceae bacterium]|nr:sensor histidine kinase [Chitinophagaceae bacterium]